jgi:hypothetical protein
VIDRPKEPDASPQVRFCERRGGAIHRAYSTKAQEAAVAADHAQIAAREANDMAATVVLGDADQLACEGLADESLLTLPLDLPGRSHAADLVVGVVPGILQAPSRKSAQRRPPQPRRRLLLQGLVRPILVVVLAEVVEALLLLAADRAGGLDVSAFSVRCMRSCRPLSCGEDGGM